MDGVTGAGASRWLHTAHGGLNHLLPAPLLAKCEIQAPRGRRKELTLTNSSLICPSVL